MPVRIDKVTTRGGDTGMSSLADGQRLSKSHAVFDALGELDELNARVGWAQAAVPRDQLLTVMNHLFDIGAAIASQGRAVPGFLDDHVRWLEQQIETLNASLEPLHSFVLPSGGEPSSRLHLCRTAARSAERALVRAAQGGVAHCAAALPYMNRLSDLFFVLARHATPAGAEQVWVPGYSQD